MAVLTCSQGIDMNEYYPAGYIILYGGSRDAKDDVIPM